MNLVISLTVHESREEKEMANAIIEQNKQKESPLKNKSQRKIKHIALGSLYYSSKFTKKDEFLDHISESFHILCSKYGSNLKFILSGDFNRLNIKPILNLSPDLKQMVEVPT